MTGRLLYVAGQCPTSSERTGARNELPNKYSLGTAETCDAIHGEQTNTHRAQIRWMHDSDNKQNTKMHQSELGRS